MSVVANLGSNSNMCFFLNVKHLHFLGSAGYACATNLRHLSLQFPGPTKSHAKQRTYIAQQIPVFVFPSWQAVTES